MLPSGRISTLQENLQAQWHHLPSEAAYSAVSTYAHTDTGCVYPAAVPAADRALIYAKWKKDGFYSKIIISEHWLWIVILIALKKEKTQ